MTWVRLGQERVNLDTGTRYKTDGAGIIMNLPNRPFDQLYYLDPDGALLRALDEACGLLPELDESQLANDARYVAEAERIHRAYADNSPR